MYQILWDFIRKSGSLLYCVGFVFLKKIMKNRHFYIWSFAEVGKGQLLLWMEVDVWKWMGEKARRWSWEEWIMRCQIYCGDILIKENYEWKKRSLCYGRIDYNYNFRNEDLYNHILLNLNIISKLFVNYANPLYNRISIQRYIIKHFAFISNRRWDTNT